MKTFKSTLKNKLFDVLRKQGYLVQRLSDRQWDSYEEFHQRAEIICQRHWNQTRETVIELNKKYEKPVLGKVRVWDLVQMLGQCIDPGDRTYYCVSDLVHVLQMLEAMEQDEVTDEDMYLAAIIHDIGKILLLTDEAPENVVGGHHKPIGDYEKGIGLDNCTLQWDHGEFAYLRFKDHVSEPVAWLIRYHNILVDECVPYMDEKDKEYTKKYWHAFHKYDYAIKSIYAVPSFTIEKYRDLIEESFPEPIFF